MARLEMIRVLVYSILFFAILNNLHRQESMQIIVLTLIFLAMSVAAYAVIQFLTGSHKVWNFISPYGHRGSGTFISPNNCAGFLEMILPFGLAYSNAEVYQYVSKVARLYREKRFKRLQTDGLAQDALEGGNQP